MPSSNVYAFPSGNNTTKKVLVETATQTCPVTVTNITPVTTSTLHPVEGWHRRLNERAKNGQANLYVLIALLHGEAQLVSIHAQLVSERKLKRCQRQTCLKYQT